MTDRPEDESAGAGRGRHWRRLGLARQIPAGVARRARVKAIVLAAVLIAVILVFESRYRLLGEHESDPRSTLRVWDGLVRAPVVIAVVVLGWVLARDVGRALGPALRRHMDAAAAGTVGFLIRLVTVATTVIVAAGFAGVDLRALVVGGAFTAVVVGLAAQQTLGNLIAGTVLLTARPFRVGERVRLQGSPGRVEGIVSSLGLLYTNFADGDDIVMVPNSVVLGCAVAALREPAAVNLRARLPAGIAPGDLERLIEAALTTPIRARPRVTLVELDGDEVVVEPSATPRPRPTAPGSPPKLLDVVSRETGSGDPGPDGAGSRDRGPDDAGSGDRGAEVAGAGDRGAEVAGAGDGGPDGAGSRDRGAEVAGAGDRAAEVAGVGDRRADADGSVEGGPGGAGVGDRRADADGSVEGGPGGAGVGDRRADGDGSVEGGPGGAGVGDRWAEVTGAGDRRADADGSVEGGPGGAGVGDRRADADGSVAGGPGGAGAGDGPDPAVGRGC